MLRPGLQCTEEFTVTETMTAENIGSGTLNVLATPVLASFMEKSAWKSVASVLSENQTTVGSGLEIVHSSPTPIGMKVRCESELRHVDGKNLLFIITAYDEAGEIARAKHERYIVDSEQFLTKVTLKLEELQKNGR